MKIIKAASKKLEKIYCRGLGRQVRVEEKVRKIIDDVRLFGDEALLKYTRKFDGVKMMTRQLKVAEIEISGAYANISLPLTLPCPTITPSPYALSTFPNSTG